MTTQLKSPTQDATLPDGWQHAKVADICEFIDYGYTASANFTIATPKFLRITDIQNGRVDWKSVPGCEIKAEVEETNKLRDGDIVFARTGGTTGKSFLIRQPPRAVFASYLIRLRPNERVTSDFIYSFFQSNDYWQQVNEHARGGAQPNVNATLLGSMTLPLPPLPEQKRIAGILKEQLAAVERARVAAKAQYEAAKALPAAYLRGVFEGEDSTNWKARRLGDLISRYNVIIHPGERADGNADFVGLEHIEPNTGRRVGSLKIDFAKLTGRKPTFKKGQIVYGYLRPYLNKVWIAEFDGCSSVDQFAFDVRRDEADPNFVAAFMRSDTFLRRSSVVTTTGQLPRISIDEILAVQVDLPATVHDQTAIAAQLSDRLQGVEQLVQSCENQLSEIDATPASLLRDAFQGKL